MKYDIMSQETTIKDYPVIPERTESSNVEEKGIFLGPREFLGAYLLYKGLVRIFFEIDLSTVYPHFEPKMGVTFAEEFYEEPVPEEMLEHDIIVRMPALKRYTIELEIKSIKKAEPKILKSESL